MNKHEKIKRLEEVSDKLKEEFVGLDGIIDEIMAAFKSWYITPEVNERPSVISLFGMTGTGKTSLIHRLIELLELGNKTLFFDCGTESNDGTSDTLTDKISKFLNAEESDYNIDDLSKDLIFVFDEFQYSRTIDEGGTEVQKSNLRPVWELVDSGTINLNFSDWDLNYISGFIEDLKGFVKMNPGIKLNSNGEIENPEDIRKILDTLGFFYYDRGVPGLLGAKEKYSNYTSTELKDIDNPCSTPLRVLEERLIRVLVRRLNRAGRGIGKNLEIVKDLFTAETIDELTEKLSVIHPIISAPRTIKCPQSLVIILGNIDEAFRVESNISPDIDPDMFYDNTSKVTINDIKEALKRRFRAEQIARLGNTIIKYPTLKGSDFKKIIKKEVDRILSRFKDTEGIEVEVTEKMLDLLYSEGVYPAQGVRPVFTTISTLLTPLLSDVLINVEEKGRGKVLVDVWAESYDVPEVYVSMVWSEKPGEDFGRTLKLSLGSLRNPNNRKTRYCCSVHEIGHAILISYLTGKVPTKIVSVSSNGGGFCTDYDPEKVGEIQTRRDIENDVMISLGGYEAEQLIFGDDPGMTLMGSSHDIEEGWNSLSLAAYRCGYFGPFKFSNFLVDGGEEIPFGVSDKELQDSIQAEMVRLRGETAKILKDNRKLLVESALVLGESGKMTGETFKELIKKHGGTLTETRLMEALDLNSPDYYLKRLKRG